MPMYLAMFVYFLLLLFKLLNQDFKTSYVSSDQISKPNNLNTKNN